MPEKELYSLQCQKCLRTCNHIHQEEPDPIPCIWCGDTMQPYVMGIGFTKEKRRPIDA